MGRELTAQKTRVLYIGKPNPKYDRLWEQLNADGIQVVFARTQAAGLQLALELQPQIVLINLTNTHLSGERLCRELGRRLPGTQRLLITDGDTSSPAPCELKLSQPFTTRKLHNSILDLLTAVAPHILRAGPVQLDLSTRIVYSATGSKRLTPKESALLAYLLKHVNQVISRRDLMAQVWETGYLGDTRTLDVHIRWLREKIEPVPCRPKWLVTRRGTGYMFAVPELTNEEDEEDLDD